MCTIAYVTPHHLLTGFFFLKITDQLKFNIRLLSIASKAKLGTER